MSVRVTCPECGAVNSAADARRGKKVRCRKCDEIIPVPRARDEDDPRDRRGQKKQGPSALVFVLVGALALLGVAGTGAGLYIALSGDHDSKPIANNTNNNAPPVTPPVMPPPVVQPPATGALPAVPTKPPDPTPAPPVTPTVSRNSVYQYVLKSAAWIITMHAEGFAMGSGSLIDRDNRLVLTNYHVVHGLQDFIVFFPIYKDGNQLISERSAYQQQVHSPAAIKGKVVAIDRDHDLALIQLDRVPETVEALPFAAKEPAVGDRLHSVGNPGGSGALWVYTPGEVRAIYNKQWQAGGADFVLKLDARVVEATSPTNSGDSGGPCVNDNGELVGVTQGGSARGNSISFFIERSMAEDFIKRTFAEAPALKDRQWVRAQRPPLNKGGAVEVARLPAFQAKLSNPDATVRAEGVQGLGLLGPDAHDALPDLVKVLDDKDDFVKRLARGALQRVGSPTARELPDLLPLLKSAGPEPRAYVLAALALLGGDADAAADVLAAAGDGDARVRQQAMRALGKLVPAAGENQARSALEKGLGDPDQRVRAAAAESLTTDVPSVKSDVKQLTALLNRKEPEVRVAAALALGRLGGKARPASPDLVAAVGADNRDLRRAAFVALKAVGAEPKELLPVLRQGLKDNDAEVRRAALEAAGGVGAPAKDLVPTIAESLADADVRLAALSALKQLGPEAKEGADRVANLLASDPNVRPDTVAALQAMKITGPTADLVAPKLVEAFAGEKRPTVRDKLAETLGKMGRPALVSLTNGLRNPSADVRRGAATSLAAMGLPAKNAAVLQGVAAAAQAETDPKAREEELAAFQRIQAAK